ncbi:MAG: glycosyltransferase family 2 protein [Candidatus Nanoarchaeia archaeon]
MEIITVIYFIFLAISIYFINLFLLLHFEKPIKNKLQEKKLPKISVIIPVHNKEKYIAKSIESVLNSNYPKNKLEIIVVDDGSTDKTFEIISKYASKYSKYIKPVHREKASGRAAIPKNEGAKIASGDILVFLDGDSIVEKNALKNLIAYFDNPVVGGVTGFVGVLIEKNKFIESIQKIEYAFIAWTRALMDQFNGVYVLPGGLSAIRKDVFFKIGGYDPNNLTEDIELAWKICAHNYINKMAFDAKAYTYVPQTFKEWWHQRVRWDIGGVQTLLKYFKYVKCNGVLGRWIIPFFFASMLISLAGFFVFLSLVSFFLYNKISFLLGLAAAKVPLFQISNLYYYPSVMTFFGILLLILSLAFYYYGIKQTDTKSVFLKHAFYLFVYLCIFPVVLIDALFKMARGYWKW